MTSLQSEYDRQHATGYWSSHSEGARKSETHDFLMGRVEWLSDALGEVHLPAALSILEIGFGTGDLAHALAKEGHTVTAVDFSAEAVNQASKRLAHKNLLFLRGDFDNSTALGPFDLVISAGTVEHTDSPGDAIQRISEAMSPGGSAFITCPHFLNIRGAIWMTLHLCGGVVSNTDRHFITPSQMADWAGRAGLELAHFDSFDDDWGNGGLYLKDMLDRVPKAMRDGRLVRTNTAWQQYAQWMAETQGVTRGDGATAFYHMRKSG